MNKIVTSKSFGFGWLGVTHMQVCCEKSATDEEILAHCNADNPSGTSCGWGKVERANDEKPDMNPVQCEDYPDRIHVLVGC